ncbi:hypothetical protein FNV43_RR08170 [Rhamnella rubrinervis]|uniref:Secreted protein n=1 Tax=Rhamnella rubrinervis TaxID=2594499 RepID=A0A8K0MN49_9ROSA|nr:hypothetical protein FNV43_RR08170 [Rhamnella rubrinervis]
MQHLPRSVCSWLFFSLSSWCGRDLTSLRQIPVGQVDAWSPRAIIGAGAYHQVFHCSAMDLVTCVSSRHQGGRDPCARIGAHDGLLWVD